MKYRRSEVETEKISRCAPFVYPAWGWPICSGPVSGVCCDDADALLGARKGGLDGREIEGHPYNVRTRMTTNAAGATNGLGRHLANIVRGRALVCRSMSPTAHWM